MRLRLRPHGPGTRAAPTGSEAVSATDDAELVAQRDRLTERFALMQSELGGLFYEMAVRDHVRMDVLVEKAAAQQRVDIELAQVEYLLKQGEAAVGGHCPSCGLPHARGAAYCSRCAAPLTTA